MAALITLACLGYAHALSKGTGPGLNASSLTSLRLSFLLCKTDLAEPTSCSCCKD